MGRGNNTPSGAASAGLIDPLADARSRGYERGVDFAVAALKLDSRLRLMGYPGHPFLSTGDFLDAVYETEGDVEKAVKLVVSQERLPARMITRKIFDPKVHMPPLDQRGQVYCGNDEECDKLLAEVIAYCAKNSLENLDGSEFSEAQLKPVVELAVSVPRALSRRDAYVETAGPERVIETARIERGNYTKSRTYGSPLLAMQVLYPDACWGKELGYASEGHFFQSFSAELPDDFGDQWRRDVTMGVDSDESSPN